MPETRHNIVQAEFFLTKSLNSGSLEALTSEMSKRVEEGSPLKLSVRFYDEDGSITRFVTKVAGLTAAQRALYMRDWDKDNFLLRKWNNRRSKKLAGKMISSRTEGLSLAVKKLIMAAKASRQIGIEDNYRGPIRLAQRSEMHELLESAMAAAGVYLFVFKPNDLFADSNELIASLR